MFYNCEIHWFTLLLAFNEIGILTGANPLSSEYKPDETIIKPCRSGTADCMFGDCTKIWLRKGKEKRIIIQCQCWPGYTGDWCNIYPPERMPWKGLLHTEGKDEITPVIENRRKFRSSLDTWNELILQYAGYLVDDKNESATKRLINRFIIYQNSFTADNNDNDNDDDHDESLNYTSIET
ncbi:unnamed protein product [Heterobilharzia americana]|nr:unnamed protein product [Heterobilharzia americana]